jgi:hypothetical protein
LAAAAAAVFRRRAAATGVAAAQRFYRTQQPRTLRWGLAWYADLVLNIFFFYICNFRHETFSLRDILVLQIHHDSFEQCCFVANFPRIFVRVSLGTVKYFGKFVKKGNLS